MDLRKLITKIDRIENKKILKESTEAGCSIKNDDRKYKNRPNIKKVKDTSTVKEQSANIEQALLEAFGVVREAENPWSHDPKKAAAWDALSPEDQAWLGHADPTDDAILSRAPNRGRIPVRPGTVVSNPANVDNHYGSDPATSNDTAGSANSTAPFPAGASGQPSASAPTSRPNSQPAAQVGGSAKTDVQAVQQQLIDLGIDVGKTGADGKLGPNTAAGIKTFERMANLPETGKITPGLLQALEKGPQIVSHNGLTVAITALEKILGKYKVEHVTHPDDIEIMTENEVKSFIMKNMKFLSEREKMEVMAEVLSEANAVVPTQQVPMGQLPLKNMGSAEVVKPSKLATFGKNLARRMTGAGTGAKGLAKAGAKMGARLIPGLGAGLIAWELIGAALDTLVSDPSIQLDPADKAEIEKHMPVLKRYLEDPAAGAALPAELQSRLSTVSTRIQKLLATHTASQEPAAPAATQPTAPAAGASGQPKSAASTAGAAVGAAIKSPFRAIGNAISSGADAVSDFAKGAWNAE